MRYICERVKMKCKRNRNIYLFLIVELSVGVIFLTFFLNNWFSYQEMQKKLEKVYKPNDYILRIISRNVGEDESPISLDEYKEIQRLCNGNAQIYIIRQNGYTEGEDIYQYNMVFCELKFLEIPPQTVLVGSRLYERLSKVEEITFFEERYYLDGKNIEIKKLEADQENVCLETTGYVQIDSLQDCMLLPMELYGNYEKSDLYGINVIVPIDEDENILNSIEGVLTENKQNTFSYYFENVLGIFEGRGGYSLSIAEYFGKMAGVLIVVLIFGFWGVLYVLLHKREYEFAVCMALGAKTNQIKREFFIEIASIVFVGCSVGTVIGMYTCYTSPVNDFYQFKVHITTIMCIIILFVFITIGFYIWFWKNINRITLLQIILKEGGQ